MANKFCDLPQELQIQILSNLDADSLIRCAMTCKSIYEYYKSSSLLLYTIQLHLDGLKGVGTSVSHSDLIKSLVRRRQAWSSLERGEPLIQHTKFYWEAYELAGGAFAYTSKRNNQFEIIWLPTASKASTLQRPLIGNTAPREFTMDPTQDLIVFVEDDGTPPSRIEARTIFIHIHSISTNAIHPRALQSPLSFTVIPKNMHPNTITGTVLQIAYNILAVYFIKASNVQVLIWDWTTSDLILDTSISFDLSLTSLRYDFGLLDSTYFFVTCQSNFGSIRLYSLVRSCDIPARALHLATLHFPPISSGTSVLRVSSHTSVIEANPLPDVPFMINDEDRLHLFTVQYRYKGVAFPSVQVRSLSFFLHQRSLLKYGRRALAHHGPLNIPWTEWGPQNTRHTNSFRSQIAERWIRYIHGQRAICLRRRVGDNDEVAPSYCAEVFDFSLAAVLCAKGVLAMPPSSMKGNPGTLLPSSIIRKEDFPLFLDDVETHLPCVMSTLNLEEFSLTYLIYADGIFGVNMNDDGRFILHIYPI